MKSIWRLLVSGFSILVLGAASLWAGTTSFGNISTWYGSYSVSSLGDPGIEIYGHSIAAHGKRISSFPFAATRVSAIGWRAPAAILEWTGPLDGNAAALDNSVLLLLSDTVTGNAGFLRDVAPTAALAWQTGSSDARLPAHYDQAGNMAGEEGVTFDLYKSGDEPAVPTGKQRTVFPGFAEGPWKAVFGTAAESSELARRAWLGAGLMCVGLAGRLRKT